MPFQRETSPSAEVFSSHETKRVTHAGQLPKIGTIATHCPNPPETKSEYISTYHLKNHFNQAARRISSDRPSI